MTRCTGFGRLLAVLLAAGAAACSTAASPERSGSAPLAASMPEHVRDPETPVPDPRPRVQQQEVVGQGGAERTWEPRRLTPEQPQAWAQLHVVQKACIHRARGHRAPRQWSVHLAEGWIAWTVQDAQGQALPMDSGRGGHGGQIAGREGEHYVLVFTNHSPRDYEVVVSVEGRDVRSGQPGALAREGYVLRAGETLGVEGLHTSGQRVTALRFPAPDRGCVADRAAADAHGPGQIGVALFEVQWAVRDARLPPLNPAASVPAPPPLPGTADR